MIVIAIGHPPFDTSITITIMIWKLLTWRRYTVYTKLGQEKLKTGETMEIGVVLAPDTEYGEWIQRFLRHKGPEWERHIEGALKGEISDLETRFYIGHLDGEAFVNIMTVEYGPAGILGHVFTRPDQRRKGACSRLMAYQMDDFRRREGGLLLLGTGFDSPAYWIYHSYGFRSMYEGSGFMRYADDEAFETTDFAPASAKAIDVAWRDWPRISALTSREEAGMLKSLAFELFGAANFEHGFLGLKRELERGRRTAKLLESEHGAIVGCATIGPHDLWPGGVHLLDLFIHPNFWGDAGALLDALDLPSGKVQCYADTASVEKISLLENRGFKREALLKRQLRWQGAELDVAIYAKDSRA